MKRDLFTPARRYNDDPSTPWELYSRWRIQPPPWLFHLAMMVFCMATALQVWTVALGAGIAVGVCTACLRE